MMEDLKKVFSKCDKLGKSSCPHKEKINSFWFGQGKKDPLGAEYAEVTSLCAECKDFIPDQWVK